MTDKKNNSGRWNSGYQNSGHWNSGDCNTGNRNSGDCNSGYRNSGDRNSGCWNSGYRNSGSWNSGYRNSGNSNTGDLNSGDRNSGNGNTGNRNSGDRNSGNRNSGSWNKSHFNNGYFNTVETHFYMFNKLCNIKRNEIIFPDWLNFYLTEWVYSHEMNDEEKKQNPDYQTSEGYLKVYEYQEAAKLSWNKASLEDKQLTLLLPNFDPNIFYEIFGIDLTKENFEGNQYYKKQKCTDKEIIIDGKKYKLVEEKQC